MNIPVITQLVYLIEEIFKAHGQDVAKAAEQAATGAVIASVEQDPKVRAVTDASVALIAAAQSLKTAIKSQSSEAVKPVA